MSYLMLWIFIACSCYFWQILHLKTHFKSFAEWLLAYGLTRPNVSHKFLNDHGIIDDVLFVGYPNTQSERNLISINLIVDILRTVISNQIDLKIGMNEFRENCIDAIEIISIIIDPAGSFFSNLVNISFVGMNSTVLSSKIVSSKQCLRIGIFICGRQRHLYNN